MSVYEQELKEKVEKSSKLPDYNRGYEQGYVQALLDINTPQNVIQKDWDPSICPRCNNNFDEDCNDGYYVRATCLERCPHCGQKLEWFPKKESLPNSEFLTKTGN